MLTKTVMIALREIWRNGMRSLLTTLGVVIGVGSVIGMVMLGDGATANVTADISALGEDMLMLSPGAARHGPGRVSSTSQPFEEADAEALAKEIPGLRAIAPAAARQMLVVFGNKNHRTLVQGTTPEYFDITGHTLASGRTMNTAELNAGRPACVMGETVRAELFGSGDPLGSSLRIGKVSCVVVGLLAPKPVSGIQDPNDLVVMPLKAFQRRVAGNRDVSTIYMSARPDRSSAVVKQQVLALMRERRRLGPEDPDDFNVRDMEEIIQAVSSATGTMTALLGGIAAVSLIVGGIGIMNIMLVSVTERTREIGIRRAIGARSHDVLLQFLIESVVLSLLGGAFGVLFGLGLGAAGAHWLQMPIVFSSSTIVLAFSFSACVGVLFGYLPARKAAHLSPIEALRHE
jgi:putative ABC transport system permease protein